MRCRDLEGNALTGELPAEWAEGGSLPSLELLNLQANDLGGPLPAAWGGRDAFKSLVVLCVYLLPRILRPYDVSASCAK